MNLQRVVEDCMAAIFDDLSIHPSGVITAHRKGHRVRVTPVKEDGEVVSWSYVFTDRHGNQAVSANTVSHAAVMIGRIQRWSWSL